MPSLPSHRLTRREFVATAGGLAGLSLYGASSNGLDSTRTTLSGSTQRGQRLRVALLTDMHGPHNWIDQDELIAEAGGFQPDLVCVVGDAVDRRGDEHLVRRYADLPARLGKFATLGNWEYQGECDLTRLRREYERAGVRLLINERVRIDANAGGPVDLIGLDDWRAGSPDYDLVSSLPPAPADAIPAVVLCHCPVGFDAIIESGQAWHGRAGRTHPRRADRPFRVRPRAAGRKRPLRERAVRIGRRQARPVREPGTGELGAAVQGRIEAGVGAAGGLKAG